jgi:S-adenosylmethionine/arginine decarboxylase-like enzyme
VKARILGAWIHEDVWATPQEDRDWDDLLMCNLDEAVCTLAGVDLFETRLPQWSKASASGVIFIAEASMPH